MRGDTTRAAVQNEESRTRELSVRLGIVTFGFVLFFVAIVMKLLSIQVIDVEKYREKASRQYLQDKVVQAERGAIFDRKGILLAESVQRISLHADPHIICNTPVNRNGVKVEEDRAHEVATLLSGYFGKPRDHYYSLIKRADEQQRRFVWIERSLPVDVARPLMEHPVQGIWTEKEQHRYYLNLASQVVGLVNTDNKGISGLELKYDSDLRGHNGLKTFQRSATGGRFLAAGAEQVRAEEGISLELTLDADIQAITEEEITRAALQSEAKGASGIVMDVRTGEILAMASYPSFDMNNRSNFRTEQARNRPLADAFDPGSTFKIVMAAAATEVLGMTAEDSVDGHGGTYRMFNKTISDHEKLERMTFRDAMVHSSNIVSALTAMEIGPDAFYDYVTRFGFGRKTGVGLVGESSGIVRKPETWGALTLPWMGHGYSLTATPIQVLQAYATIANDGVRMKPYIIRRFLGSGGETLREFSPQKEERVVASETAKYLREEYFRAIVEEGTGRAAAVEWISIGGKTGTAQKLTDGNYNKGKRNYISSFVGFFPVEKPRIAAIVVVDEPKRGYYASTVAAPAFSKICSRMVACSEPLKEALGLQAPELAALSSRQVAVPLLDGLRLQEAEELLEWSGLRLSWRGDRHGLVALQDVEFGSMVEAGSMVGVQLSLAKGGADREDRDVQ
ncbi:penicillin-binding transpeptidase domain-containing protein [Prosthecochloris vibrioformis]|uniref:Peptidoglycan glycosyltransferase n=1 Tax=Prosthecochloris vibrioformis TaxID=1098 RepID=A0A5C4S4M2_PROVB|nr:penicillin-binding transpeptidase domain-containing protein [Prosthecochloris vibrioformis]TNJ37671.1 peptidoglycan glycosyltransferase [Prosthecochloris vibrioformis]